MVDKNRRTWEEVKSISRKSFHIRAMPAKNDNDPPTHYAPVIHLIDSKISLNSSTFITFTFGNEMLFKMLKCLSLVAKCSF